jgi:2-iminobutanoate/2-iminopropanoate deaminase
MKSAGLLLFAMCLSAAELTPVFPPNVKPVGPYTPGISAGNFVYVSGQGGLKAGVAGYHEGVAAQTRQCLENVREILATAGLTMEHIVYTQVYVADMSRYDEMARAYDIFFRDFQAPARAVIGVARMPLDTPVEISAVAVKELGLKKSVWTDAYSGPAGAMPLMRAADRVYMSGILGRDARTNRLPESPEEQVELAVSHAKTVLKANRMKLSDLNIVTVYVTDRIPRQTAEKVLAKEISPGYVVVPTATLPRGANVQITGISARDLQVRTGRGETDEILKSLGDLSRAVVSNVYIDNIDDFKTMNAAYATFFKQTAPTRTTVQPLTAGAAGENQISVISLLN